MKNVCVLCPYFNLDIFHRTEGFVREGVVWISYLILLKATSSVTLLAHGETYERILWVLGDGNIITATFHLLYLNMGSWISVGSNSSVCSLEKMENGWSSCKTLKLWWSHDKGFLMLSVQRTWQCSESMAGLAEGEKLPVTSVDSTWCESTVILIAPVYTHNILEMEHTSKVASTLESDFLNTQSVEYINFWLKLTGFFSVQTKVE